MSETEATTRRRSSVKSSDTATESTGVVVETYEDALEAGYIGGPIDDTDYTVSAAAAASRE